MGEGKGKGEKRMVMLYTPRIIFGRLGIVLLFSHFSIILLSKIIVQINAVIIVTYRDYKGPVVWMLSKCYSGLPEGKYGSI